MTSFGLWSRDNLKVLLIVDFGTPHGGAELQMIALREGLRARGHEVRLLTSDASPVEGLVNSADRTCRGRLDRVQALTQTVNLSAWRTVRHEIAEYRPDIVHLRMFLWQLSPLILPAIAEVPTLYQAAVFKAICPNGMKLLPDGSICEASPGLICLRSGCVGPPRWISTMGQLALLRRWRQHIDQVAALSPRMAAMFEAEGWGPVAVLGNGVEERPARPPLGDLPVVAYAGRLSREKGVETLISAFARIAANRPGLRLLIAGTGPLEATLRTIASPLGGRIAFLGHLPRSEMEAAFDRAWVQVVPSLWHEPFGNVSIEAMMRGTAVIASDVGGQSDIVRDGTTGYLVPPGDPAALADRLARVVYDRAHAEALGAEGRRVALADYSRDAVLDRLESAYRETIEIFAERRGGAARIPAPAHIAPVKRRTNGYVRFRTRPQSTTSALTCSVIVPSFNRPDRLRECLEALVRLDEPSCEIVVVDDGSVVPLSESCAEFAPRVRFVRQQNSGPAAARNTGVRAASGDFIAFTDDDCRPLPGWLTGLLRAQDGRTDRLVGGRVENALPTNMYSTASHSLCEFLYDYYGAAQGSMPFFTSNNIGCARDTFERLGGFDEAFPLAAAEDRDFGLRWRAAGGALVYAPEAIVRHAHAMDLPGYWRQHARYGRGARHLHRAMGRRGDARPRVEPLGFYAGLVLHPLRKPGGARLAQVALLALSQLAMIGGYAAEARREGPAAAKDLSEPVASQLPAGE